MTQEEKAKAYDEAIKMAQRFYNNSVAITNKGLEDIFPELKESEDERMVKFIKNQLFNIKKTVTDNYKLDTELTKAIDWLEKQCERKPYVSETMNEKGDFDNGFTRMVEKEQTHNWSEEDEQYLLVCKNALAKYQTTDKWDASIISHWLENKLKSLKERYIWKPSNEQMEGIECTIKTLRYQLNAGDNRLDSLYNDLKKLK